MSSNLPSHVPPSTESPTPDDQSHAAERIGVICALLSAVGYSIANGFLRAVSDCDPALVCSVKALWTIVIFGPWLVWLAFKGDRLIATWRPVALLCLTGTIAQFGGNMMFQLSLDKIGLAFAVPLCLGTLIMTGALLGKFFLKENLNRHIVLSILVLIVAIVILNIGSAFQSEEVVPTTGIANDSSIGVVAENGSDSAGYWKHLLGGLAASFSGASFATLSVTLRYFMRDDVPLSTPMVITGAIGFIGLGAMSVWNLGWDGVFATESRDMWMMSFAGLANAAAFLAITRALQLVSVVTVNIVNASQVAMGAALGVALFGEQITPYLLVGCALTVVGFVIRGRGSARSSVKRCV